MAASGVSLAVTNQNWLDVVVYAVRGLTRVRIGQVAGNESAELSIPKNAVVTGQVQLMADPVGSSERYFTDSITVDPDQQVQPTVAPAVAMSSYALRLR